MNDVTELLERAAPPPIEPLDLDAVSRRARARRRHRRAVTTVGSLAALVVIVAGAFALGHGSRGRVLRTDRPTATTSISPAVRGELLAALDRVAQFPGDRAVRVDAVRSTHKRAVTFTMGDGVVDDVPVWVVQAEFGRDIPCERCRVPFGAAAPSGRVLTLILGDPGLGGPLDLGLSDTPTDLSRLGPVVLLRG
jgi:hypothetical protein